MTTVEKGFKTHRNANGSVVQIPVTVSLHNPASITISPSAKIGDFVVIASGAFIDSNVEIGDAATIGQGARISFRSLIGEHVTIGRHARIGDECRISERASVEEHVIIGRASHVSRMTFVPANWMIPADSIVNPGDPVPHILPRNWRF